MKTVKPVLLSLVVLLGVALTANDAFARRGHGGHGGGHGHWRGSVGFYFGGGPWYGGGWGYGWPGYGYAYPRPYYYSPYYYPAYSGYSVYSSPPVYVEQPQVEAAPPAAAQLQPGYWYYCRESNGYYPNVQQCAGAWIPVPPRQ